MVVPCLCTAGQGTGLPQDTADNNSHGRAQGRAQAADAGQRAEEYLPGIFDEARLDRVIDITQEGLFAGVSSGGAVSAALKIAREEPGRVVVCIICDRGDRYLSTGVFAPPPPLHHSCISGNLDLTLQSYRKTLSDQHTPIFMLFTAPWPVQQFQDCITALPVIDGLFATHVRGGSLLRCIVSKTREEWKDSAHPLRSDLRWRETPSHGGLAAVPTLAYLGTAADPLAEPVANSGTGLSTEYNSRPVPALLKDLVRDMDKLVAMWTAIEIEAMPKGLYQAIMSGITDLVAACLAVCGDKESVIARVRDDRGGNAIHLAAIHGHWQVIQVLADNGADLHAVNDHQQSALDLAIEMYKKLSDHDHQVELSRRLQETIDYLANQHNVISYEYVQYEKKKTWFKRPDTMLKWLRLKNLLEYHFDNLKQAFLEIDTNHSGGIVKYEWEAMFGAEGQVKEALAAAGLESNDVFAMLDGLDVEGKMVITKSAFDLLEMLDWHLTSRIWQDLILKPLMAKPHSSTRQRNMAQTTAF
eukprot:s67_g6.t3